MTYSFYRNVLGRRFCPESRLCANHFVEALPVIRCRIYHVHCQVQLSAGVSRMKSTSTTAAVGLSFGATSGISESLPVGSGPDHTGYPLSGRPLLTRQEERPKERAFRLAG